MSANQDVYACRSEQIASYLDSELDPHARTLFEEHVTRCLRCATELREQRQLLCALDGALAGASYVPLPKNFVEIVAARAESDMGGVREKAEHRRALHLSLGLALAAFVLLGRAAGDLVLGSGSLALNKLLALGSFAWTTLYDVVAGFTVISRAVSRGFIPESHFAGPLAFILIPLGLVLLSRLIASYHRTRLIE